MKKVFVLAFAAMGLMMVSCEEDQTSLDFGAVKGNATITGKVTYLTDEYDKANNLISTEVKQNATNATVTITVENSEYASEAVGVKTYEASVHSDGTFTATIPVGAKPIYAKVAVKSYVATYSKYENNALISYNNVEYSSSENRVVLNDGQTSTVNISLNRESTPQIISRSQKATIEGKVVSATEAYTYNAYGDKNGLTAEYTPLSGMPVVLTFVNSDNRTLLYETTTNSYGEYSVYAELFDNWQMSNTIVTAKTPYKLGTLVHHYCDYKNQNWSVQTVNIVYNANATSTKLSDKALITPFRLPDMNVTFDLAKASDKESIKGIGGNIDYDDDHSKLYYKFDPLGLSNK